MEQRIDSTISDEELVYMINSGNEDAKDILYKKYDNLIYKELNRVKKSAYALHIEWPDVVQEAMVGFANAISSYDQESEAKFLTYATLCVQRRLYNFIKKYTTGKSFMTKSLLSIDDANSDSLVANVKEATSKEPLNKLIIDESLVEVKKKMDKLTDEEQVILDYATNGLKPEAIAKLTDKSSKQIYNILYRARKKIKL